MLCCFLQLVVKEVASLPEEEGFEVTASEVVETMLVTEALAETSMETVVNFQVGQEARHGAKGEGEVAVQVDRSRRLWIQTRSNKSPIFQGRKILRMRVSSQQIGVVVEFYEEWNVEKMEGRGGEGCVRSLENFVQGRAGQLVTMTKT
ncbi:hypothetical protein V6N13_133285 [Hibiscus sabdariffa]